MVQIVTFSGITECDGSFGIDEKVNTFLGKLAKSGGIVKDIKYAYAVSGSAHDFVTAMIIYEMPETNRQITETSCEERL